MDRWGEGRLEGVGVRVWVEELVCAVWVVDDGVWRVVWKDLV